MKMRIFILVMLLLVLGSFAFAQPLQEEVPQEELQQQAAEVMVRLGLMRGYGNGELGLERNISRAEFATVIVRMMGYEEKPFAVGNEISFKDLSSKHWAYSTVRMAASLGYINGYPDKTFKPSNNITYAEAAAIMVRVLGYDDQLQGKWPQNYLDRAGEIGITKRLSVDANKPISRGDICILVEDSLSVELKSAQ